jgi:hypothetical protein
MNKKLIIGILVIIILLHAKAFSQTQETLTVTTYYPSPRGMYKELTTENLTVSDRTDTYRLHVGDSRTYLDGLDGASLHWIVVGGVEMLGLSTTQVNLSGKLRVYTDLVVEGEAYKPGGGSWAVLSDAKLKKNVQPLAGALEKILRLHGIAFEWKEPEKKGNLAGIQMGMIAQEVEKVFPEWVGTNSEGYKMLTYRGFEPLVVEAIRELKAENEMLKSKLEALESKLNHEIHP